VQYLIVGKGSPVYLQELQELCEGHNVSEAVHFVGFQHPPWHYLAAMDLYVQPSKDEALGIAAVEAMAIGKPVVAARVGGLPEVVIEGSTGCLFPAGNSSALTQIVVELLQKPGLREQMGRAGRERARDVFDLEKTVGQVERIYQRALSARQNG
jgi:glycosyltransferase involved in cell wall biosynthesis